ncbi:MAG: Uma2 family endonuclease [Anaerolineales bacterium]|nr:Uma2 family endonuclease [Anaerolineales bacterium]
MEKKPPAGKLKESALTPTWEIAYLYPYQGAWSEADYMALRPNRHVEYTDGYVEVLPMPTETHQSIVEYLYLALRAFVMTHQLGKVLFAPLRIRIRPEKYREPDIVFMRAEHAERRTDEFWLGADLVMEVVSDDDESRARDFERKRRDYAEGRIPEYWIVDPATERITVLVLEGAAYRTHGEFGRGEQATSATLPGFAVDVAAVFDAARG